MNNLKDTGYLSGPKFGELIICDDRFMAKNENKSTIWYILWIVETKLFHHLNMLGFIIGRKNNSAYLILNLLKGEHHNKYIFTYKKNS